MVFIPAQCPLPCEQHCQGSFQHVVPLSRLAQTALSYLGSEERKECLEQQRKEQVRGERGPGTASEGNTGRGLMELQTRYGTRDETSGGGWREVDSSALLDFRLSSSLTPNDEEQRREGDESSGEQRSRESFQKHISCWCPTSCDVSMSDQYKEGVR